MRDLRDYSLKAHNTFGIDAKCSRFLEYESVDEAQTIAKILRETATPYIIIGGGSNLLLTNDFEGIKPMNIVIKLVAAKITESWRFYNDTCKLSEDKGKHTGKPEVIPRFKDAIHFED